MHAHWSKPQTASSGFVFLISLLNKKGRTLGPACVSHKDLHYENAAPSAENAITKNMIMP